MKPILHKVLPEVGSSFTVRKDTIVPTMKNPWHYHLEYQLLFMKQAAGRYVVGDFSGIFNRGDIILIGPELPHSFCYEKKYINPKGGEWSEIIIAFFSEKSWGDHFFSLPEMKSIKDLLQLSRQGLKLTGEAKGRASLSMEKLLDENPAKRLLELLNILQVVAELEEYEILVSDNFVNTPNSIDSARIDAVIEYTLNNYKRQINIKEIAAIVNMAEPAFCHFFKSKTGKTYFEFLMEVRIGKACKLLTEEDMSIAEICYSCGYNSIAHFNHQFKAMKQVCPREYKEKFFRLLSA